jgi:GNAT superfamily N-acetyltransferase
MEEASVRRAGPEDAGELARLRWRFRTEHEPEHREPWETFMTWAVPFFGGALSEDRWAMWLAEAGGRAVGCACVGVVDVLPRPNRPEQRAWGYVTNVYVEPEHRGGLGAALLDEVVRWAERKGLETLVVWPSERSVSLYHRAGFAEPEVLLERPTAPQSRTSVGSRGRTSDEGLRETRERRKG